MVIALIIVMARFLGKGLFGGSQAQALSSRGDRPKKAL